MRAVRLRCEYLKTPLGIDVNRPRLMWQCGSGVRQTAYRIICSTAERGEIWDSGRVSGSTMQAELPEELGSRERVVWSVRLWDENGEQGEWAESWFEMGLLEASDWKAAWISGDYKPKKGVRYPADCFMKSFTVREGVMQARLYISACGLYEARVNGMRAGDFVLAPGHTDYRKRVQYQTIDVTGLLHEGENALTAELADGWYRGSCGAWGLTEQYGTETKLLAQLEISYADGSRELIASDGSWQWSNDGPVRFADNKDGEIFDARMTPSYSGKARLTSHKAPLCASNNVPVTEHERFKPVITRSPNGKLLLDFGQNMAGYVSFRLKADAGQTVVLRFGEMLDESGDLSLKNIQLSNKKKTTPLQQISYTCREGLNEYKTHFAVFGFRYAEADTKLELRPEDIDAIAVYSSLDPAGSFSCSNGLINRLFEATVWSSKSNHLDVPTDCPTRERHGWTGDAQIFFGTASYLFDFAAFAKKYLRDVYDWQRADGCLPQIAPYGGVDFYMYTMNGSVGWSDLGIIYPYRFWKKYGDRSILSEYYSGMKRYAEFMIRRIGPGGAVRRGQSYGEWAEPADVRAYDWKDFILPHTEVSTAYTAWVLGLMAEIAEELGKTADAQHFSRQSQRCKKAYGKMFRSDTQRQAELVRPLYMDLLDEEQAACAKKRLIEELERYGWRLGTGFLSTPLILDVLSSIDVEAAYRLLENEEIPGWLSMPKGGATTIWEAWEGPASKSGGIGSLNHYSKGAVCEWLFSGMCGIKVCGERRFVIEPLPGGHVSFARACYDSIYGRVESGWERQGGRTVFTVSVPPNCTAEIKLPDGRRETAEAGSYRFEV